MSFISVEPQSRILLESHNNGLLAQFDTQLRIIADRYLAFFQERRSIEETYIDSLRKLHRKAETVDASFDPRAEPTTTRTAWDKVRDNLGREADVQQAFIDILANDVIKPLETLKEWKNKKRNWIKDNLRTSASQYADHAETKVLKLQQALLRKYKPQQHGYSTNVSQHPQDIPNKTFGSRVSALFGGRREDWQGPEPAKSAPSDEGVAEVTHGFQLGLLNQPLLTVSDDIFREAVTNLNRCRIFRTERLEAGYDLLEKLVFSPTIKDVLVKYMDGMINACAQHDGIAKSTGADVEAALGGTDTSDLKASFHRSLSFSTPPLTLYRNYRPGGHSNLIFGVPLVDNGVNDDNVPKVMRMCIDEVEKRGLNVAKIYSVGACDIELLRRFESEKPFSFASTDNIHSVAALLKRYLYDLPEPLFVLSLTGYTYYYTQHRVKYPKENLLLLRSKIRELHPVHRASLEALLRHLLRVATHSGKNAMTAKELSGCLHFVLGEKVSEGDINLKELVMEDLIKNAHTLFDEPPSQSPPVPSSNVAETTSTHTSGSLFSNPEMPESAEIQATGSTSRRRPGIVDGIPASAQSSFSSFPSDVSPESRPTPLQTGLLSPLLGLSSSKTLMEGVETTTQEQVVPKARATKTPPDVVPLRGPNLVAEWRLHQSQLPPDPEAPTIPQSPPESVLSSPSDFPLSSATSLQTRLWSP